VASFYVENFGCRAAQADGAAIESQFRRRGLERAGSVESAEFVVVNTCAVTSAAERDARAAIRRIRRTNPGCEVIVTGCYAQRAPGEVRALPGVSRVIGNSHKHNVAQIALAEHCEKDSSHPGSWVPLSSLGAPSGNSIFVSDIFAHTELAAAPVVNAAEPDERTRPNLKVQDGCNSRCSFCIIPFLRGPSRSLALEAVLAQVNELVAAGYREVVISGINLGRWGRDFLRDGLRPPGFADLVRAILDRTPLQKLRISSVEPMDWTDSLIQLMAGSPRIAKHAHLPLQSGSDRVLGRMHRKYRAAQYREKIEKLRAAMPSAALGGDVMVGFPGETQAEFDETRRLIEELPLTYLHVFTFSPRPGTPAASMPAQVPANLGRERNRILRDLAAEKKQAFMRGLLGERLEAITLGEVFEDSRGTWTRALTDNYLKLRLKGRHAANQWLEARADSIFEGELAGEAAGINFPSPAA